MLSATNQNHTHLYISQEEFTFYYSENSVVFFSSKKNPASTRLGDVNQCFVLLYCQVQRGNLCCQGYTMRDKATSTLKPQVQEVNVMSRLRSRTSCRPLTQQTQRTGQRWVCSKGLMKCSRYIANSSQRRWRILAKE